MISQYILRIHNYEILGWQMAISQGRPPVRTIGRFSPHHASPFHIGERIREITSELRQAVSNYTPHLVTFSWEAHGVRLPFFVLTRECRIALRFPNFLYLFHTLPAHVSP